MARTTHLQQAILKPWGHEIIIENNQKDNLCLKILHINPGQSLSWQFHKNKTETFYVTKGVLSVAYGRTPNLEDAEVFQLRIGDSFKVYPYQWHQLSAYCGPQDFWHKPSEPKDVEIIECSSYHEDSDTYKTEADWYDIGVSKKKE